MGTLWLDAVPGYYATFAPIAASDAVLSAVISDRGIVSGARRYVANPIFRAPTRRRTHADKIGNSNPRYNTAVTLIETSTRVNGDVEWKTLLFWRRFVSINIMMA
jgi:hypothetical protein